MSDHNTATLSLKQLVFVIVQVEIGISIFSLPNTVHKYADHDSWISLILLGAAFELLIIIYMMLHKRLPEQNLFGIADAVAGKFIGKIFNILYIIYFLGFALFTSLSYVHISKSWLLPFTPWWVLYAIFIITGLYMARSKINVIARFCGLAMLIIFILLITICFALPRINVKYILPIGTTPIPDIVKGAFQSGLAFTGIVTTLAILPSVKGDWKGKFKAASFAILFVTFTYVFTTIICLLFFSDKAISIIPFPVLFLLKSLTIFKIFERVDITLVSAWIVPMMTTYTIFMYLASKGITQVFSVKSRTKILVYLSFLMFVLCLAIPTSESVMNKIAEIAMPISYIMMFAMPSLYLLLSFFRKNPNKSGR